MYERYRIWRKKVEFIFCSALADSTPKQLVSYLKYWMGDQGIPLIERWESTGKLDYSNAEETPATEGGRRRILSSGYKVQTYWDLLDEEFKPKGSGKMNFASTLPQTEAEFFDEKGLLKEYRPPIQQQQQEQYHTGGMFALRKIPISSLTPSSSSVPVPDPDPAPIPSPDFPFQEFPLTEVVTQSQIDSSSISDTLVSRECSNSSRKATKSTDLPLQSGLNSRSHEEMRENRDLTVSDKHTQSSRDSSTISISDNSATRKSIPGINPGINPGIMTDTPSTPSTPTTFSVETDVTDIPEEEIQMHSSNHRSVIPTDIQALTALQSLVSDDFQAKNTHSTKRKGEETPDMHPDIQDEAFQLIQKIHNQLQQVQWDLQRLHSYISIRTNSTNSRQVLQSISNSTNKN